MKFLIAGVLFCFLGTNLKAQTIKRQVISSLGTNRVMYGANGANCTSVTLGQPPNAGTATNGANYLRQGFQQPANDRCPILISYTVSEVVIPLCGTYYIFEYTGDISPSTSVNWNFGGFASPSIFTGAVTPMVAFANAGVTSFTITVADGTCSKTVSSSISVAKAPFSATATILNAWCLGDKGTVSLNPISGQAPYTYVWNTGAAGNALTGVSPGVYRYTITDNNGCVFSQTAEVLGSTQPLFMQAHVLDELCTDTKDGSIELSILNGMQPITYEWGDTSLTSGTRERLSAGAYSVTISDANGCKIDTSFSVRVFCELNEKDFIPDVFSPNGDAFNQLWNVPMLDRFPDHLVQVYNRWGNLIWEANKDFLGWDGTNKSGNPVPMAAYYYVIRLNDAKDTIFKGSVTLIR